MRSYRIDELTPKDMERIIGALDKKADKGRLDGMYWLNVPETLLNDEQKAHLKKCGPFSLGLEVGDTWLQMELLVRARAIVRCSCIAYATPGQRDHMMNLLDSLLKELDIPV